MSYSEEKQRAYTEMEWKVAEFQKMKDALKLRKCAEHDKKLKMGESWEEDYAVNIYISKYCCIPFAKEIGQIFLNSKIFDAVIIEPA